MHTLVFRTEALDEVTEAAEWYDLRGHGLGAEFLRSLDAAVASVRRDPNLHPPVHGEMRRALFRRFPYSLIYLASADEVVVLACAHWRQDPATWQRRQ
jgi:toxin ParE1/3/4